MNQPYVYALLCSPSHLGHRGELSRVPWALQFSSVIYFTHSSTCQSQSPNSVTHPFSPLVSIHLFSTSGLRLEALNKHACQCQNPSFSWIFPSTLNYNIWVSTPIESSHYGSLYLWDPSAFVHIIPWEFSNPQIQRALWCKLFSPTATKLYWNSLLQGFREAWSLIMW